MSTFDFLGSSPSQRRKTALAAIDGYNSNDIDKIMAPRTATCTQEVLPKSLNRPIRAGEVYRAYFSSFMPHMRNFKLSINELIEDEKANKIVVWAKGSADTDIGQFENEYIFMLYFTEDGDKLERFVEFVDSAFSTTFIPELVKHIAANKEKKGD